MAEGSDRIDPDPAQIERNIAHTRAEMTETIDALGARFEPSYIKEQAQEAIADTARSAGTSMLDTIKDNPLPAGIAAMSIAWLFANRSAGTPPPRQSYAPPPSYGGRGSVQTGMYAAGETDPSLTDRASDLAGQARDKAGSLADQARSEASHLTDQASQAAGRAESWLEGQMRQNPLGVGAVALAAGALVGVSLPETQIEARLMGEQAGQVVDRAQRVAGETFDRAKEAATAVASEAKDKAADLADQAKKEASDVASDATDKAQNVAEDAKDAAQSEVPRVSR